MVSVCRRHLLTSLLLLQHCKGMGHKRREKKTKNEMMEEELIRERKEEQKMKRR